MGFGVSLDLRHLYQGLPLHTGSRIFFANDITFAVLQWKHQALTDIGIVGNGDKVRAGFCSRIVQPLPQIFRLVTIK